MQTISIDYNQFVSVKGLGRSGPAQITDIVFSTSDPNIVFFEDTEGADVKRLITVSLGQVEVGVTAKNFLGVELSTMETVVVMEGSANALLFNFGELIPKG